MLLCIYADYCYINISSFIADFLCVMFYYNVMLLLWKISSNAPPPRIKIHGSEHSPTSDCYSAMERHTTMDWWPRTTQPSSLRGR